MKLIVPLMLAFCAFCLCVEAIKDKEAVRLQDVQVLTFTKGEYANSRRRSSVLQLRNIGGEAKGEYEPHTAMCRNIGFDGRDVAWKCEADLPIEYSLGKVTVTCEGYEYPQDSYVLKDSCALEYNLEYSGQQRDSRSRATTDIHMTRDLGFFGTIFYTLRHWIWNIVTFPFTLVKWFFMTIYRSSALILKTITALAAVFVGLNLFRALSNRNLKQYPKSTGQPVQPMAVPGGLAGGSEEGHHTRTGPGFMSGLMGGGLLGYFVSKQRGKDAYQRPDGTWTRVPADLPANATAPMPPDTHESEAYGKTKRR